MKLQVISKKFFRSNNYYSKLEKTIIYINLCECIGISKRL